MNNVQLNICARKKGDPLHMFVGSNYSKRGDYVINLLSERPNFV
jgi:hypothetical protein